MARTGHSPYRPQRA